MRAADAFGIVFSKTPASLDVVERDKMAASIMERLKAKDVLWEPEDGVAEAALPSFHSFIRKHAEEKTAALRRSGAGLEEFGRSLGVDVPGVQGSRGGASGPSEGR